jgi:Na+-transporting NADH:ubiquinone oxidoreductase subunit NqrD
LITILQPVTDGGWYIPNGLLLLPPSAFFIIALFIAIVRTWKPDKKKKKNQKNEKNKKSKTRYLEKI